MSAAVAIKNLYYSYGDRPVLRDLSIQIDAGDFFIIIGPNGSGKTTLLKTISGILSSRNGVLEILGRSLQSYTLKALAQTLALVPQTPSADFPFTAREVVLMGRSPHLGMLGLEQEKDLEIARQAMRFTQVEHLADRTLDQLSGGERQRVFIARAICQEPRILLLDEPTASLDLAHQVRVMDLMEKLKEQRGTTIVMVSHDVNLAAMYGDRLLLLKDGQIVSQGTSDQVLTQQTLEKTYGCRLLVEQSAVGNFPRVTPLPQKFASPPMAKD